MSYFSSLAARRRRIYSIQKKVKYPEGFGSIKNGAMRLDIRKHHLKSKIRQQPTPIKEFINFKNMSGNEILINLDNCDNLAHGELIGGMLALARKDRDHEFDWNNHAITKKCLEEIFKRISMFNAKNVLQIVLILDRLQILDQQMWNKTASFILKLMHKYNARDIATIMDLFDKEFKDDEGEDLNIKKADAVFFERFAGIFPVQIPHLNLEQLIRSLEILVKRNLGSERVFRDHLLLRFERNDNILKLSVDQYRRMILALADKQYIEDTVFWKEFVFKYVEVNKSGLPRQFSHFEAKKIWDAFVYLKLKCPPLDVKDALQKIESFMENEQTEKEKLERKQKRKQEKQAENQKKQKEQNEQKKATEQEDKKKIEAKQ